MLNFSELKQKLSRITLKSSTEKVQKSATRLSKFAQSSWDGLKEYWAIGKTYRLGPFTLSHSAAFLGALLILMVFTSVGTARMPKDTTTWIGKEPIEVRMILQTHYSRLSDFNNMERGSDGLEWVNAHVHKGYYPRVVHVGFRSVNDGGRKFKYASRLIFFTQDTSFVPVKNLMSMGVPSVQWIEETSEYRVQVDEGESKDSRGE